MEDGFHGKNEPTAGFENPININVDDLLPLEGYSGEHELIQENDQQVLEMAENMKKNRYTGGAVMIWITMFGRVGLAEGNHRVRAAKLAGLPSVPTTVKYFEPDWPDDYELGGYTDQLLGRFGWRGVLGRF